VLRRNTKVSLSLVNFLIASKRSSPKESLTFRGGGGGEEEDKEDEESGEEGEEEWRRDRASNRTVQAFVRVLTEVEIVLDDIEHACHLAEDLNPKYIYITI